MFTRLWLWLWQNLPIVIGYYHTEDSWAESTYSQVSDQFPPFHLGQVMRTDLGFRVLLFRWLTFVDLNTWQPYYLPLVAVDLIRPGGEPPEITAQHLTIGLIVPPERGKLTLLIPLSVAAIRQLGLLAIHYDSWAREPTQESEYYQDI